MSAPAARLLNAVGLLGLSGILAVAFGYQFALGELPCPLCLLQRVRFVAAGIGLALNVAVGSRPSHYAMVILSAMAGGAVSIRQILLHIVPGTGSYGSALFGLHFYTWSLIAFVGIILAACTMLMLDRQLAPAANAARPERPRGLVLASLLLFLALTLLNAGATFAECGFGLCPDDPTDYQLFSSMA